MKQLAVETVRLQRMAGGGQALGELPSGKKIFVWGGLPGEMARVQLTKQKSSFAEGIVVEVLEPSAERVEPQDPDSYLSTSPWQVMSFEAEQRYKAQLIAEAFELHKVTMPGPVSVYTDDRQSGYRNKVEFSWYWDNDPAATHELNLAFFRRGSHGKIPVAGTSLAHGNINKLGSQIAGMLQAKGVAARQLKTLLIRCDQAGNCVWQLYIKDNRPDFMAPSEMAAIAERLPFVQGGEVIYSDPRSPASRITERLAAHGNVVLQDEVLGVPFKYATEGFFQVNIPVYEQALREMRQWVPDGPVLDLYSGVGSIGLTIGGDDVTLVEVDEHAYREMRTNIQALGREKTATAVWAASEKALGYVTPDVTLIVDPPRAGMHQDLTDKILEALPPRIIYLSCNPVTQARDVSLLLDQYKIVHHKGYNFFPRTPHIEHLVVLGL